MVYIVALKKSTIMPIYSFYQVKVALLTSIELYIKYFDFSNIFILYSVVNLLEHTRTKNYFINLLNNKKLPYGLIYSLALVELKTLKTYIIINLASILSSLLNLLLKL